MRRIYGILALVLIAVSFWLGMKTASKGTNTKYDSLHAVQDLLTKRLEISMEREKALRDLATIYKKRALASDELVRLLEQKRAVEGEKHHQAIKKVERYDSTQLDKFFNEKYPEARYVNRPSYNLKTARRPVMMYEWMVREIAMDRLRLDSATAMISLMDSTGAQQRVSIKERDFTIEALERAATEQDSSFSILLTRESTYKVEISGLREDVKKYKRQRNFVIAGATVVVGGLTYLFIKAL